MKKTDILLDAKPTQIIKNSFLSPYEICEKSNIFEEEKLLKDTGTGPTCLR